MTPFACGYAAGANVSPRGARLTAPGGTPITRFVMSAGTRTLTACPDLLDRDAETAMRRRESAA